MSLKTHRISTYNKIILQRHLSKISRTIKLFLFLYRAFRALTLLCVVIYYKLYFIFHSLFVFIYLFYNTHTVFYYRLDITLGAQLKRTGPLHFLSLILYFMGLPFILKISFVVQIPIFFRKFY